MTAEQEKQIQTAKLNDQRAAYTGAVMSASMRDRRNLITIIDDLQKQQPKRYTEAELRAEFENYVRSNWLEDLHDKALSRDGIGYEIESVNNRFAGWIKCANFLGMIKTEGES